MSHLFVQFENNASKKIPFYTNYEQLRKCLQRRFNIQITLYKVWYQHPINNDVQFNITSVKDISKLQQMAIIAKNPITIHITKKSLPSQSQASYDYLWLETLKKTQFIPTMVPPNHFKCPLCSEITDNVRSHMSNQQELNHKLVSSFIEYVL